MAATIEIVVETIDDATKELKQVNEQLDNANKAGKEQELTFNDAGVAINQWAEIVKKGFEALQKLYAVAREGAEIEYLESRFDNLSESIGTTSDALLGELREATRGTISDLELMATATDFVGLGLANNSDEAVRLAKVSSGLNFDMNQLVLTLTNMTTMRFDALGVRVDGFAEKVAALEEQGYSTNDAFKEAFLQQAETQLELVGNAADSTLGSFKKLESQAANMTTEMKLMASEGIEPAVKWLGDLLEKSDDFGNTLEQNEKWILREADARQASGESTKNMSGEVTQLVREYDRAREYGLAWERFLGDNIETTNLSAEANRGLSASTGDYLKLVQNVGSELQSYTEKQEDLTQSRDEAQVALETLISQGWRAESEAVQDAQSKLDEYNSKLEENTAQFEESTNRRILARAQEILAEDGLTVAEEEALLQRGLAMGVYTEEYVAKANSVIEESQRIVDGINNLPDHKEIRIDLYTAQHGSAEWDFASHIAEGRAVGGDVKAGTPYIVGERGPEMFMPNSSGSIVPNNQLGSSINVTLVYSPAVSVGSQEEAENILLPFIEKGIRSAQSNNLI